MIELLATYWPDCEIFKKDYRPGASKARQPRQDAEPVNNADGFYDGLPLPQVRVKRANLNVFGPRESSLNVKLERARQALERKEKSV
jgi:hypothetical protein